MALSAGQTIRSLDAKLYYNTGTYAVPVWSLITVVKDVTLGNSKGKTVIAVRGSSYNKSRGTLKDVVIGFSLQDKVSDAAIAAFNAAYFGDTEVDVAVLSGEITDVLAEGMRSVCEVLNFSRNEQLTETLTYDVSLEPSSLVNDPVWMNGSP